MNSSPIESEEQTSLPLEQDWHASSSFFKRSSYCCWHPWQSSLDCCTFYFACLYLDRKHLIPICGAIYPKHSLPMKKSPYPCEYGCSWTCWYFYPCAPCLPLLGFGWRTLSNTETLLCQKTTVHDTGSRSGSTQLSQYLGDNPQIVSHPFAAVVPLHLALKLLPKLLGRWMSEDKVYKMVADARPEFLERKECTPLNWDLEVVFSVPNWSTTVLLWDQMFAEGYGWGRPTPDNIHFWQEDLVDNIDAVGKKLLYFSGPNDDSSSKTLFIKGHFLGSASWKYSDAHFLTVLRLLLKKIELINFFRVAPEVCKNGAIPWDWLVHCGQAVKSIVYLYEKWYEAHRTTRPSFDSKLCCRFRRASQPSMSAACHVDSSFIHQTHAKRKSRIFRWPKYAELNMDETLLLEPLRIHRR